MPFNLQISALPDIIQKLGVPVATVIFVAWLLVQERKRTDEAVTKERERTDKAEERAARLQEQLLRIATAQTEATMKAAVALSNVTDSKDEKT